MQTRWKEKSGSVRRWEDFRDVIYVGPLALMRHQIWNLGKESKGSLDLDVTAVLTISRLSVQDFAVSAGRLRPPVDESRGRC